MTITIKDLAKLLNLAPSTVSMALNNNPKINKDTRKKISDLAKKLNYRPNIIARAMVRKKTHLVGVMITDIMSSFFPQVIQGIEDAISEQYYSALLCSTSIDYNKEKYYLNLLRQKRVDGILADPLEGKENTSTWKQIDETKIPLVNILNKPQTEHGVYVGVDNFKGGLLAGHHLIESGRKIIAHLEGPKNLEISRQRKYGLLKALNDNNIEVYEGLFIETPNFSWQAGYQGMSELLKRKPKPEAVFCSSDITAIGASFAIRESGLKVPDDIAIIGFDDLFISAIAEIPLTTIAQPKYDLGKIAGRKILALIEGKEVKSEILEPKLIVRCSCGGKNAIALEGRNLANLTSDFYGK